MHYWLGVAGRESIFEINGAFRGWRLEGLGLCRIDTLYLLRVGRNQTGFSRAGHDLQVDVVLAGKKQALAYRELTEALFFFAGKLENVG